LIHYKLLPSGLRHYALWYKDNDVSVEPDPCVFSLFSTEDEGSRSLRNVGIFVLVYKPSRAIRQ